MTPPIGIEYFGTVTDGVADIPSERIKVGVS